MIPNSIKLVEDGFITKDEYYKSLANDINKYSDVIRELDQDISIETAMAIGACLALDVRPMILTSYVNRDDGIGTWTN